MGKMKRIFKIIVIGLLSLFVISTVGLFIFLKTFNVSRFKPQIISAAQNALSRSVNFGDIALKISLTKGIQLRLTDMAIGEHSAFGRENFLTAQELNLGVSVKELILKRQIRILGVEAQSLQIKIIRLKDGRINVQSFGMATAVEQRTGEDIQQKPQDKLAPSATMGLPAIFINRIDINNARLTYIDYSFEPKLSLAFDKIALQADNFSLTKPFPIMLRASFASASQNIFAQGKGEVNMGRLSFLLKDVKATADLSTLSMDTLRRLIPQLEGVPLPEIKSGALSVSIELFEAGPQGLIALKGSGSLEIKEGQLTDINVLKMVLDKLSFVPNLATVLETGLPERFKESLRKKDTIVTGFKTSLGISNSSVAIQSMNMDAETFSFQGSGRVGFDQVYSFDGSFMIPQDLSSRMVAAVPEMEYLLDEAKQIHFPLKVSGKGASVSFFPDVKQMGITAIKYKGRQELEKVLDKVFDRAPKDDSKQPSVDTESTDETLPGTTQEKSKKQQLIEGVIDTIFKQ